MNGLVVSRALGRAVVTVHGLLGLERRALLERLLLDEQAGEVIVDLRQVPIVDEHATRMLVEVSRVLEERGRRLSVGCGDSGLEADLALHGVPLTSTHRRRASV